MIVRRARGEDAPALTALVYLSKQSNGYDDAFMAACADELRVTADRIAQTDFLLAEDTPGVPRGCACLTSTGAIEAFFIHPDHKRRGIGRLLWTHLLKTAKTEGIARLTLEADPAAVPFYRAMGFEVVGEAPSGSIPGRVLPQMALTL
ncbi:GNAT family N-acetyltransferase [uncultured Sulfitobacter sp.]|uniref:GNAT family N-acetyltransferase n=1 Tax=uncultured Sulfitobacter sp. TaxID=191468 RepID=UPI002607788B|nr:GNAT family N-acetyltransferase [uncultured Sulfitobacter sp.]